MLLQPHMTAETGTDGATGSEEVRTYEGSTWPISKAQHEGPGPVRVVAVQLLLAAICTAPHSPLHSGGIVLSDIQQIVLTNLEYFHLRVPNCSALGPQLRSGRATLSTLVPRVEFQY